VEAELRTPTRRLLRLLSTETDAAAVRSDEVLDRIRSETTRLYQDPAGRLVAERAAGSHGGERVQLQIEWPTGLPPQDWSADTVIAGEDNVFALTPTPTGQLRVEPLPSGGGDTRYTWGSPGAGPLDLYQALVRGALRTWEDPGGWFRHHTDDTRSSQLWDAITNANQTQPLRLQWPQVQAWARADLAANPPDLPLQVTRTWRREVHPLELRGRRDR